jgi:hypothetical protein
MGMRENTANEKPIYPMLVLSPMGVHRSILYSGVMEEGRVGNRKRKGQNCGKPRTSCISRMNGSSEKELMRKAHVALKAKKASVLTLATTLFPQLATRISR